jgi:hypothetical protein
MDKWMRTLRDIFLMQMLRRDGCANASTELCPQCRDAERSPLYRCQECTGGLLLCKECCVDKHADAPLHVIYVSALISFPALKLNLTRPISEME